MLGRRNLGIISTLYNAEKWRENKTWGRGIETIVSAVSLVPGWGWAFGAAYFVGDAIWQGTHHGKSIAESIDGE